VKRYVPFLLSLVLLVGLVGTAASTTPVPENLPLAVDEQRRLIAEEPGNAAARNDLGNLLVLMGDTLGAELSYRTAVELAPNRPAYRYNLALLLHDAGDLKQAAESYREVLELDPSDAWAHYQLGAILEAQGKDGRAIERYAQAFRLDPGLAFADVNPLILESDLVTEAMLLGYKEGMIASRAPRVYNDPNRIARLLVVDPEETQDEAEPPAGMRAEQEPNNVMMGEEPDGAMPPSERKVLDQKDISGGSVNQASPTPRAGYRPPSARPESPVRSFRPSQPTGQAGNSAARQRGNQGRNQGRNQGGAVIVGGNAPGDDEPTVGGPSDPRRRRDGGRTPNPIGSTGSLRMELEPEPEVTTRNS